jgi:hypothetical protein
MELHSGIFATVILELSTTKLTKEITMTTTTNQLGELLGVEFEIEHYPVDGHQVTLRNSDTFERLHSQRYIGYTLWESVTKACHEVWADEIEANRDYELPGRIATALGIEEDYGEED